MSKKQIKFKKGLGGVNGVPPVNGVIGVTEAESLHYPEPKTGRVSISLGFDTIYDYDKCLDPLIEETREKFAREVESKLSDQDLEKINQGISSYVLSSTKESNSLDILKASIQNALGFEGLLTNYEKQEPSSVNHIPHSYFEGIDFIDKMNSESLISKEGINNYRFLASKHTYETIETYLKCSSFCKIEQFYIYRGIGAKKYYKNHFKDNSPDFISVFTMAEEEVVSYFERQFLSSFSINKEVAEKFMVSGRNQRRALLTAELEDVYPNIFSSFIVSDLFDYEQYEILMLPNPNDLFISTDVNDELGAEYHISSSKEKPNKLLRKPNWNQEE